MVSSRKLGHYATVRGVNFYLRRQSVGTQAPLGIKNRSASIVTRRFYTQNQQCDTPQAKSLNNLA
jgi:hypothetical protein